jgi:hypothetical protein
VVDSISRRRFLQFLAASPLLAADARSALAQEAVIRQALNIESWLNDGLALPFFLLALAAAAEADAATGPGVVEVFVRSLVLAGAIGGVRGSVRRRSRGRMWSAVEPGRHPRAGGGRLTATTRWAAAFIAAWVASVAFMRRRSACRLCRCWPRTWALYRRLVPRFGAILLGRSWDA